MKYPPDTSWALPINSGKTVFGKQVALSPPFFPRTIGCCSSGDGRAGVGPAGVGRHSFVVKDRKFIAPLRCEKCGGNAHLIRRSPHAVKDLESRVFECHECGHQMQQIVAGEERAG